MKALSGSVPLLFLALAVPLILGSCASFGKPATTLTPRSESVCDQAPPSALPPIPESQPEIFAAFRQVIGQYRDEILKAQIGQACRDQVRAENAKAAGL